jgi:hypothetical protein
MLIGLFMYIRYAKTAFHCKVSESKMTLLMQNRQISSLLHRTVTVPSFTVYMV